MNFRFLNIVLAFLFVSFLAAPSAFAQLANPGDPSDKDISISVEPSIPGPKQEIEVTIKSYLFDLNSSLTTWSLNGEQIISDYGRTSFRATTGELGEKTTVSVAIVATIGGKSIRIDKKVVIEPSELDILWEAPDTYVPPFYEGKALPSRESIIKAVAMPNVTHIETRGKSMTYTWTRNFDAVPSASGYGRQMFLFKNDYLKDTEQIGLTASDIAGSYNAKNKLTIIPTDPKIIFYEKRPSTGTQYQFAVGNGFSVENGERTLIAEPYFFSPRDKLTDTIKYSWKVGVNSIDTPVPRDMITLQSKEGATGTSILTLEVESIPRLFQKVVTSIRISLGSQ